MKSAPFKYVRSETMHEALSVLAEHGESARVLAGGQSLSAMLNMRIVTPAVLLDINRTAGLDGVGDAGEAIVTGALVRQSDALADRTLRREVPLLTSALPHVGHYQTRNRGTLAGSVAHADPSGEIPLVLSTLGGEVELQSKRRRRRVKASDFFRSALVTDREPDELVVALYWPKRRPGDSCAFLEFAIRGGDFAIVSVAAILDADRRLRLGFGGCGETPQVLEFREFGPASTQATADKAASRLDYRADVLASSTYRRQLASVLAATAISTALARETSHA